jgi:hypothetical protein
MVDLLFGDDQIVRSAGIFQECEGVFHHAIHSLFRRDPNLLRVGIDSGNGGITDRLQQVDEVAVTATDHEDVRVTVFREMFKIIMPVECTETVEPFFDVLGSLPKRIERFDARG